MSGLIVLLCAAWAAAAPSKKPRPAAAPPESPRASALDGDRAQAAAQLWKVGLGYFASGDAELARVQWFACAELDPANEACRQGLEGLKRFAAAPPPLPEDAPAQPQAALPRARPRPSARARGSALAPASISEVRSTAGVTPAAPRGLTADPASVAARTALRDPREAELLARAEADRRERRALELESQGLAALANGEGEKAREFFAQCVSIAPKNSECELGLKNLGPAPAGGSPQAPAAAAQSASNMGAGTDAQPRVSAEDPHRSAVRHWNEGIRHFQRGEMGKAKQEWQLCREAEPANLDCETGIQRVEAMGGGR